MYIRKQYFILTLVVLFYNYFSAVDVFAQETKAKLIKNSEGISVYVIKNAHENLNRIIANTQVEANYLDILCLIKDFGHQKDWIYANHEAYIVDSISPYRWVYYALTETPWPLLDRDVVAEVELSIDTIKNSITIHSIANPELIPPVQDVVRIQKLDSKWTITKLDQNHSLVELDIIIDVGGSIPRWVVNLFSSKGPLGTFKNLKKEVQKNENRNCAYLELLN